MDKDDVKKECQDAARNYERKINMQKYMYGSLDSYTNESRELYL